MTTNWDGPYIQSYSPDDLTTPKSVTDNGRTVTYIYALRANGDYGAGEFRGGSATVPVEQRDNYPLVEEGDIISAYTYSTVARHTIAQFIVTDITIGEESDGTGTIIYTGPGLSKELARKINRRPYISNYYTGTSTWYSESSIYLAAAHQQTDGFYNGGIYMMLGFYAEITGYDSGDNKITVANWSAEGQPGGTSPQTYTIYHGKTLDNLKLATDYDNTLWLNHINGIEVDGTPVGSFHPVEGKTCLEMLDIVSKETGWRFRQELRDQPRRILDWFDPLGTPVDSGIVLAKSTEYTPIQWQAGADLGVVVSCNRQSSRREGWTRIVGSTEDGITLAGLTLSDITVPTGFSVDFNGSMVVNTAVEFDYHQSEIFEKSLSYPDIKAFSDTPEAIKEAQISLFYQMVDTLRQKDSRNYSYDVTTVLRTEPQVGEQLQLIFERYVGSELQWDVDDDLWIRGFGMSAESSDGIRYINFQLGDHFDTEIADGNKAAAQAIKSASSGGTTSVVYSQSSSPPSTLYRHSNLLGLGVVSDHPDYLLKDGSRTLIGNLIVDPGIKLDTVDLSSFKSLYDAHILLPDVHHDPVTAGNHVSLSGQQVSVITTSNADSFPEEVLAGDVNGRIQVDGLGINTAPLGSGLDINGYISLIGNIDIVGDLGIEGNIEFVDTTHITTDSGDIYIEPATNLYLRPGNKRIYLDDSIYFDAAGNIFTGSGNLLLNPFGDLDIDADIIFQSARSIETVSGILTLAPEDDLALSPVGENVTIAANLDFQGAYEITTVSGLLTIAPYLGLVVTGNAAFGEATDTTNAAIKAIPINDTDYALYLKQRTNQDAYIFKIEAADSTDALIVVTKEGDLESGSPGFSTGATGWQITHDGHAEFWSAKIRGELHATSFVAGETSVVNGSFLIVTSGVLHDSTNLPSLIDTTFVMNVTASITTPACQFSVLDNLRMQFMGINAVGLDTWEVYVEVQSIGSITDRDLSNNETGYFPVTCIWRDGGEALLELPVGIAIGKWGSTWDGVGEPDTDAFSGGIMMNADDTNNTPYISVFTLPAEHTWGTAPVMIPRVHQGNLDGILSLSNEWGIALGTNLSDTGLDAQSVIVSNARVELNNVDLQSFDSSGNPTILIASDGSVKFGSDINQTAYTSFYFSVDGNLLLGDSGGANAYWDTAGIFSLRHGTNKVIYLDSLGDSWFAGTMTINTTGQIVTDNVTIDHDGINIEECTVDYTGYPPVYIDNAITFGPVASPWGGIYGISHRELSLKVTGKTGTAERGNISLSADSSNSSRSAQISLLGQNDSDGASLVDTKINSQIIFRTTKWGTITYGDVTITSGLSVGYGTQQTLTPTGRIVASEDVVCVDLRAYLHVVAGGGIYAGSTAGNPSAGTITSTGLITAGNSLTVSAGNIVVNVGDVRVNGGIRAGGTADVAAGYIIATQMIQGKYLESSNSIVCSAGPIIATVGGLTAGISTAAAIGTLLLNQGTRTDKIIQMRSTSFSGMVTQGMDHTNTFGQFQKIVDSTGGLAVMGAGASHYGIWLEGSANVAHAEYASIMMRGNLDNAAVATTGNLLILQNSSSGSRVVVKGDGDFYVYGTYTEGFDHLESDVEMVRAHSLLSPTALRTQFDDFVRYNRDDLIDSRLIEEVPHGYLVNTTGMMRLHSGALWQLHQRITGLEEDVSFGKLIKKFFSKVFAKAGKRPN